jgi:hypothetical protein
MIKKLIGFLNIRGWPGVEEIYLLVGIGVAIGMTLAYYFLVYQKEEMPTQISIKANLVKILLMMALMYFLMQI